MITFILTQIIIWLALCCAIAVIFTALTFGSLYALGLFLEKLPAIRRKLYDNRKLR